jgi:hypothetical protein
MQEEAVLAFEMGVAQAKRYDALLRETVDHNFDSAIELFYLARRREDARVLAIASEVLASAPEKRGPVYFGLLERSCVHAWKHKFIVWLREQGIAKGAAVRAVRARSMPAALCVPPNEWPDPEDLNEIGEFHDA